MSYPEMNLNEIEVDYPQEPSSSFRVEYQGGNEINLFTAEDNPVAVFDTSTLKDYMLNFKKLAFENYRTGLSEFQTDSIRSSEPYQIIRISDSNGKHEIKLWPKKAPDFDQEALANDSLGLDRERVYATYNNGEMALAQRFVWEKFRAPIAAFVSKN